MPAERKRRTHIKLTSHPGGPAHLPIVWAAADPKLRGPVIASTAVSEHRNVIGTHAGSYAVYRALAVASGTLDPQRRPDLTDTAPLIASAPIRSGAMRTGSWPSIRSARSSPRCSGST